MKLGIAILGLAAGCQPSSAPPSTPTDQAIYTQLVEAGCLAADGSSPQDVTKERSANPPPAWFNCLANGGTVAGCNVPCK